MRRSTLLLALALATLAVACSDVTAPSRSVKPGAAAHDGTCLTGYQSGSGIVCDTLPH